jgi:peptide/nickel transport system substrate-binding protein
MSVRHLLVGSAIIGLSLTTAGTVTFYDESLPSTMNPLFSRSMVDVRAHELTFDRVFYRSGVTNDLKSRVVEKFMTIDNGAGLTLFLKPGIKWHDGRPLSAEDVCFSVDVLLDPANASPGARGYRESIKSCTANKDGSATITFKRIFHNPRERLGFHLIPKHMFPSTTIDPAGAFSTTPVGTGTMQAVRDRREVRYTPFANPHHATRIEGMAQAEGQDPFVQVRTLLNSGVHGVISVAPRLRPEIAASDDVGLQSYDLRSWWFVAVNTARDALSNRDVRAALDLSIDRSALRQLTVGFTPDDPDPACTFVSGPFVPSSPYYNRAVPVHEGADLAAAAERMKAAGATQVNGRWMWKGQPIKLTIGLHAPLETEAEDLLAQLGNQLQQAGFDRQVFKVTNDDWARKALPGQLAGQFDLLVGKWSFGLVEDVNPLFQTRSGENGAYNLFNYSNPAVDGLLAKYNAARTDTEARDAYHALHAMLATELPYLFLWRLNTRSAWRNEVRNNLISPYFYFTEFDGWSFEG